jgi:hypothetical protein
MHQAIKSIQQISAYPQHVGEFIKQGGIDALIEVLEHPNPDIAIESIILLTELTEEDLLTNFEDAKRGVEILVSHFIAYCAVGSK